MKTLISLLAMTSLAASPAVASLRDAAYASGSDRASMQTSVFAGATWRVGLDRRTADGRGRASLRLAGMTYAPGSSEIRFGQGLELAGGKTGRPALHLAGQDVGQLGNKAQLNGTSTALIVGGVLVLGLVAALAVSDYQRDQRCIGEEGDCD